MKARVSYIQRQQKRRGPAWWAATPGCTKTTSSRPRTPSPRTAPWPMWSAPRGRTSAPASCRSTARSGCGSSAATPTTPLTPAFWRRRVEYAWAYRKTVLEPADLTACRVIFGEADQFPGLTVDRFHDILVTQTLSVGMEKLKPVLFPLWPRCCGPTARPLPASTSETTRPCAPRKGPGAEQGLVRPARRDPPRQHPDRDLRERRVLPCGL